MEIETIKKKWAEISYSIQNATRPMQDIMFDMMQLMQNMLFEVWVKVMDKK